MQFAFGNPSQKWTLTAPGNRSVTAGQPQVVRRHEPDRSSFDERSHNTLPRRQRGRPSSCCEEFVEQEQHAERQSSRCRAAAGPWYLAKNRERPAWSESCTRIVARARRRERQRLRPHHAPASASTTFTADSAARAYFSPTCSSL